MDGGIVPVPPLMRAGKVQNAGDISPGFHETRHLKVARRQIDTTNGHQSGEVYTLVPSVVLRQRLSRQEGL